jgi:streptomycin 3"-adenylyltransferase
VQAVIDRLTGHLDKHDPGGLLGLYLYGSAAVSGLRPSSDIDLLMVTERSLGVHEREGLVGFLFQLSGRRATVAPGRPLELTSAVRDDVVPWSYPPRCDFLYGEWLRTEFADGRLPQPHVAPDLAVLLTTLQQHALVLRGPDPADLLRPVPPSDLRRSLHDSLSPLLDDLVGDERNVLLTLARMLVTLQTGEIVAKDEAVRRILPVVRDSDRSVLALAAGGYLGQREDDWSHMHREAYETAAHLATRIRASRAS